MKGVQGNKQDLQIVVSGEWWETQSEVRNVKTFQVTGEEGWHVGDHPNEGVFRGMPGKRTEV